MRQRDSGLGAEIIEVLLAGRIFVIDEVGDCVRMLGSLNQRRAWQVVVLDWLSLLVMVRQRLEVHGRLLRLLVLN